LENTTAKTLTKDGSATTNNYRVAGQQAIRLSMHAGDTVVFYADDAVQGCDVLVLNNLGEAAPSLLLKAEPSIAKNTLIQLAQTSSSSVYLQSQLTEWGVPENALEQALCFTPEHFPKLEASEELVLIVIAAGVSMSVEEQKPTTELLVAHTYHGLSNNHSIPAPLGIFKGEPIGKPIEDIHVPHSSARTYTVKAGQWIQIIDVQGKQCSDFLAFDKTQLEQGEELTLDGTVTRTMNGHSVPTPGLFSRFYDQNLHTMIEVVQDTVGRHDSFLMACSPKYYEDSGYFGHSSCTENFNNVLSGVGIKPRANWPAINFFFNTNADEHGVMLMDEPWSRPGDYVLLRAMRDLVCASSACPDDIDPANGWKPTDIHVRIYDAEHQFPKAIAHRSIPQELPRMTKNSAFHFRTSALTKQFDEYRGYWVPTEYEGWGAKSEYIACRERVVMIDMTALRKFEILGPDAEALMQYALTRNVRRVAIGEIVYSAMCHETGGMIDDGTLFRMGEQAFRWICGDEYSGIWLRELAERKGYRVTVQNSTDQLHNLAVQGPKSRELLNKLIWNSGHQPSVESLKWFHFMIGRLGDESSIPLMISRTGYTGELGFEVWCHPDNAEQVWDAIWEAGQEFNIAPMGFAALDMLRIEAGLIFAGYEFCPETNPYEAGIGFTVPMKTKEEDFVGRAAMARQPAESRHKLMGLELDTADIVDHGDQVFNGRFPVGVVTSVSISPLLNKQIAMCRLAPDFAIAGNELEIGRLDGHQKRISATVTTLPFYDPERTRVRS
jgi:aminomethyltransferase